MKFTKSGSALVASAIGALLLLSACTGGGNPDPSTSSTNTASQTASTSASASPTATGPASSAPPSSSALAIAAATTAAKQYWAISDLILQQNGKNPGRVDAYASGQAAKYVHDAAALAAKGGTFTGNRTITVTSSYSSDVKVNGKVAVPNGFVGLAVCNDVSKVGGTEPNGSPAKLSDVKRSIQNLEVQYDQKTGTWKVTRWPSDGGTAVTC